MICRPLVVGRNRFAIGLDVIHHAGRWALPFPRNRQAKATLCATRSFLGAIVALIRSILAGVGFRLEEASSNSRQGEL